MQSTKNRPKREDVNRTPDTNPPHPDTARCLHLSNQDQSRPKQSTAKDLREMIMDANILVCVSMAAAQGVIALYQERGGELDAISEMAVTGLQHSINMVGEAILKMEVYA